MSQDSLRIGLVGVAHREAMAERWDKDARAKITAGADVKLVSIERFRNQYAHNRPFVTTDWREMIARDDIHYATQTTRNYLVIGADGHAEMTDNRISVRTQKANKTKARARAAFETATYEVGAASGGHGGADPRICRAFLDLVLEGKPAVTTPLAGRMVVAVGCAATESIRNGNMPMPVTEPKL